VEIVGFSFTQILRKVNDSDIKISKTVISTILDRLHFNFDGFQLWKKQTNTPK